jgi:hypothetical protein
MNIPRTYKIAVVILVSFLLAVLYLNRINIYEPIKLEILSEENCACNDCKVSVVSVLGRSIDITQDSFTNNYCIDFGYFNKIIIKEDTDKTLDVRIYNINTNSTVNFDIYYSDNSYIINRVGEKSFLKIVKRIVEISGLRLLIIAIMYIFTLIIIFKFSSRLISLYSKFIGIGLLMLMIGLLLTAGYYTYPNAEDLSNTVVSSNNKSITETAFSYLTLDTRFSSNLLYSLSPMVFGGVEWHKISVFLYLFLIIFSFSLFIKQLIGKTFSLIQVLIVGLTFVLAHYAITPDIAYDLYFVASSSVYLMGWVSVFLWVSTFLMWINTELFSYKAFMGMLTTFLFMMSFGFTEMNFVLNLFVLGILTYYILKYRTTCKHELILLWLILMAAIVFVLVLPGFENRVSDASLATTLEDVLASIKVSFHAISASIFQWIFIKVIYIPLILVISIALYPKFKKLIIPFTTKELLLLLVFAIVFMFTCYAYYIYFAVYQYTDVFILRSLNYINWAFQLVLLVLIPVILNRIMPNLLLRLYQRFSLVFFISLIVISASLILGLNNYKIIFNEFVSGEYSSYKNQMIERYEIINQAKEKDIWKIAEVDEIIRYPRSIFVQPDLGWEKQKQDAIGDYSHYYERFFEIDEIKLKSDSVNMALKLLNYE